MRVIPTSVHGVMDYLMGIVLIAAPWLLGFAENGAETWVPVIIGAGMIAGAMITNYECGVVGIISMSTHLTMDVLAGILLAASPWLFGFAEEVWIPHLVLGVVEVAAGLMTQTTPSRTPHRMEAQRHPGV